MPVAVRAAPPRIAECATSAVRRSERAAWISGGRRGLLLPVTAAVGRPADAGPTLEPLMPRLPHIPAAKVSSAAVILAARLLLCTSECHAAEIPAVVQVPVTVAVKPGTDLEGPGPSPTLFLTAKPANNKFPFASLQEVISEENYSASWPRAYRLGGLPEEVLAAPEQYGLLEGILGGSDVIVSARLDKDGDPNTRDREDLVGRGLSSWDAGKGRRRPVTVQLEGRGLFGKMVTTRTTAE